MGVRPILTLALTCCTAAAAFASPRTDPTAGRAVFTGATLPGASSIALNPAALGLSSVNELFVMVTGVADQFRVQRRHLDIATDTLTEGERISDTELGLGGMLAAVFHAGTRYTVSFELRTPPPVMAPTSHEALRYHTRGARQRDYIAALGATFKVSSRIYFGASFAHDVTFLRLRYARDTALAEGFGPRGITSDCGGAPCGIENPLADEHYDVDVRSRNLLSFENFRVNLGVLVQIYRDVWLGIGYHTPPGLGLENELVGDLDVRRAPRDGGGVIDGSSSVIVSFPASVDVELRARLARLLDLHVGGRWEDLSRMRAYDVRTYGRELRGSGVPEWMVRPIGMRDGAAVWAGLEQVDFGQTWRFGGRFGIERAAATDARLSPLAIAPMSGTIDLGAQLRVRSGLVQLSYGLQYFPAVDVADSAFDPRFQLDCIDSGFDYSTRACRAVREGYAVPTAAGEYGRLQHSLRLMFSYELP